MFMYEKGIFVGSSPLKLQIWLVHSTSVSKKMDDPRIHKCNKITSIKSLSLCMMIFSLNGT